jgi:hypothetical protein
MPEKLPSRPNRREVGPSARATRGHRNGSRFCRDSFFLVAGPGGSHLWSVVFDSDARPANGDSVKTVRCLSAYRYRTRLVFSDGAGR